MLLSIVLAGAMATAPAVAPADTLPTTPVAIGAMPPITLPAARLRPLSSSVALTSSVGLTSPVGSPADAEPTPQLIEYSDGYFTRLTIHKWASYLTLPIFAGEFIVGQKLMNDQGNQSLRNAHRALTAGLGGLFAVNTVTGGLNTIEAWKDPEGRTRRTLHSALMLLSDAGFLLTAAMANEYEREGGVVTSVNNTNHRRMAIASMSTAMLGYVIMLPFFGND